MGDIKDPFLSRHLFPHVRRVMAMWLLTGESIERRSRLCGISAGEFIHLNRILIHCEEPAVAFCRDNGLPVSASVRLEKPVKCPKCGSRLESLPCVMCFSGPDDDIDLKKDLLDDDRMVIPVSMGTPTDFKPGSPEKIELLRQRVTKRERLFHPEDRN